MVFFSDLDNTLIYSYKHDIGNDKESVEIYNGRKVSFMTRNSIEMLKEINRKIIFVPITTRTKEQYARINMDIGEFTYALVCNGGVLLINGKEDEKWYEESLEITKGSREELKKAQEILASDEKVNFEVRNIKNLFVFTKSEHSKDVIKKLEESLDLSVVDIMLNGVKIYVLPKNLNKVNGAERFKKKINAHRAIASGDSIFDISMLNAADIGIAPKSLGDNKFLKKNVVCIDNEKIFSEEMLKYILHNVLI